MRPITEEKLEDLTRFMDENGLDGVLITDFENARNVNLKYLSGHPSDAAILIRSSGESFLVPWDVALAEDLAEVDEILNISNYKYNFSLVIKHLLEEKWGKKSYNLGVPNNAPYGFILKLKSMIRDLSFFEEPKKLTEKLRKLRSTKSPYELKQLRKAAEIGNKVIQDIRELAANSKFKTENDLSFLVRKKISEYGAEDIAFDSLVANSSRSHELHCHPSSTNQKFAEPGLALIDFGAKYNGYHSDITVPITFGTLNEEQQEMIDVTFEAYDAAIEMIDVEVPLWKIHDKVEKILEESGYSMPYSLGHGLGLSEHDAPLVSRKPTDEYALKYWEEERVRNGMVFTIEPGVYKKGLGGVRIENDVLVKDGSVEILTDSKLVEV